ncbi:MAG TPA: S8 family serine peptidase [Gaiellaceae bacterium]|nr:S8 family serine peptidase [Gaiellaceae bacterium]
MTAQTPSSAALRRAALLVVLALFAVAGLATSASGSAPNASAAPPGGYVVRARPGQERAAEALVRRLGGTIRERLEIINGFSAALPARTLTTLRSSRTVLSVTPNRRLAPQGSSYSAAYDPSQDGYSLANITQLTGARAWWSAGYTGAGVGVALIDSGVAPVQGLADPGKVVYGPDLSLESQAQNLQNLDTYGHGTFMAGLIAGRDAAPSPTAPASTYLGMAPGAQIVSLKVGDADGGTDVVQVIAAIDWVVQHRNDNGLNIRVINLSYGTNSTQNYQSDPLAFAAEQAWKAGIVVVAATGNTGYQRGKGAPGLADPAYDPFVIAVAGADTMGSTNPKNSVMASYSASSGGCGSCKNPDFAAPSAHMQGLRVPNSFIDANHPEGLLSSRYFRGSGTSEATAITSGAIALVLQKYPGLSPDGVKKFFTAHTFKIAGADTQAQGAGEFQLGPMLTSNPAPGQQQKFKDSTGAGTIEGSRGSDHLTRDGVVLSGEEDIFGAPLSSSTLANAEANGDSWSGGFWNGNSWSGNSWSGSTWSGSTWSGNSWSGSTWSSSQWAGNTWSGSTWSGSTWSGSSWSGSSWSGGSWAGAFWG